MDAVEVDPLVGVRHHIPEPGRLGKPLSQLLIEMARRGEAPEGIAICRWRAQFETCAHRQGQIEDDLDGLPEMQNDGVRLVGHGLEILGPRWQLLDTSNQMPLDGGHSLREDLAIEPGHSESPIKRCS